MDEDLKTYLEEMKRELRAHTEAVETRLLREFWKWARQADARYRQHHSAVTGLDERVMLVEDRITAVESRDRGDRAI
jgi:hypothetical protein